MNLKSLTLVAALLVLGLTSFAAAESVNPVSGDANWYRFVTPSTTASDAFWNRRSYDGQNGDCNIGYWLMRAGACSMPGFYDNAPHLAVAPDFLGAENTRSVVNWNPGEAVTITAALSVTDWTATDKFGWYEASDPKKLHILFDGFTGVGQSASFVPSGNYGFFITSSPDQRTFLSGDLQTGLKTHFAVFRLEGNGHYIMGTEDMWDGADWDYNDLVFDIQITSVPEPMSLVLLGTGLLGVGLRARRRRA